MMDLHKESICRRRQRYGGGQAHYEYRFYLSAVMILHKKQSEDSQGSDDTSFDEEQTCVDQASSVMASWRQRNETPL
jgi:hypothetical protein